MKVLDLYPKDLKIFCQVYEMLRAINMIKSERKATQSFVICQKMTSKVYCVIGRPIYESGDAGQNIKKIIQSANNKLAFFHDEIKKGNTFNRSTR